MRQGRSARGTGGESLPEMLLIELGRQYYSLHDQHEFSSDEAAATKAAASTGDGRLSIVGFLRPERTPAYGHVYVSRLRVEGAQAADQGEYLCVAQSHKLASHYAKSATTLRVIVGAPTRSRSRSPLVSSSIGVGTGAEFASVQRARVARRPG